MMGLGLPKNKGQAVKSCEMLSHHEIEFHTLSKFTNYHFFCSETDLKWDKADHSDLSCISIQFVLQKWQMHLTLHVTTLTYRMAVQKSICSFFLVLQPEVTI